MVSVALQKQIFKEMGGNDPELSLSQKKGKLALASYALPVRIRRLPNSTKRPYARRGVISIIMDLGYARAQRRNAQQSLAAMLGISFKTAKKLHRQIHC